MTEVDGSSGTSSRPQGRARPKSGKSKRAQVAMAPAKPRNAASRQVNFPAHAWQHVRIFTVADWDSLEEIGTPGAMEPDCPGWKDEPELCHSFARKSSPRQSKAGVMSLLDTAFTSAISEASYTASTPDRQAQQRLIESIQGQAVKLLATLDYDEAGNPRPGPREPIAETTFFKPWFHYLKRGIKPAPLGTPGAGAFWSLLQKARPLIADESIPAQREESRKLRKLTGAEQDNDGEQQWLDYWTITTALEAVPTALALLAAVAEQAKEAPIVKAGKGNFERALAAELFVRLAHAYHEMFGRGPRAWLGGEEPGVSDGKRPGPPAFWARRILQLAVERDLAGGHEDTMFDPGCVRVARIRSAILGVSSYSESTLADRIRDGWAEWKRRNDLA